MALPAIKWLKPNFKAITNHVNFMNSMDTKKAEDKRDMTERTIPRLRNKWAVSLLRKKCIVDAKKWIILSLGR